MATTLNMTLLLRRAAFEDSCVLKAGEPGYFIDLNADGSIKENAQNGTFKIGDGKTTWKNLPIANKSQIETIVNTAIAASNDGYYTKAEIDNLKVALQNATSKVATDLTAETTARSAKDTELETAIGTKLATEAFNTWKDTHESDHAQTATEITAEIAEAVKVEENARKAADKAITDSIGTVATGKTVVEMISAAEAAAKSHAETKASAAETAAKSYAESQDTALAQTVASNLANEVSKLETKIANDDATTLASAKTYAEGQVATEKSAREAADSALDTRLGRVEAFFGTADKDGQDTTPDKTVYDALDTLKEIQDYIIHEGEAAADILDAIGQNASDIEALANRVTNTETSITTLGDNKLDKSTYNTYISGKSMSDNELKAYADDKASTAKSEAISAAADKDTALHTIISKEIDDDVKAAIDTEVSRANGAYESKGAAADALAEAKTYAAAQDTSLKTTIEGASTDASSAKTIAGAKKYAEEKAEAARASAVSTAASDATTKADNAKDAAIATAATDAATKASTAEGNAKSYTDTEIAKEKKRAEEAEASIRTEFEAADTTVLSTAKKYTDDTVTAIHEGYQTATVKDATHDSATNPSFITSISIEKGHVTGATVRNLAEVLASMEFIFDGGTSVN